MTVTDVGRFIGGVAALIYDSERAQYLVLKRSPEKDYGANSWECVTGRVDQGEGFEEALYREVREEVGLEVKVSFIIGTTHFYRGEKRPENELIGVVFCCEPVGETAVHMSQEHSEYRWVTLEDIQTLHQSTNHTEQWLFRVMMRAEQLRMLLPDEIVIFQQGHSFELG
ncbi:MAG: NUDIX domain-containing protein [Candidatus Promineifilaceae bacterium]